MVIDLQRCMGCGACIITCKNENNVQDGFTWADKISKTVGKFPNVRYEYLPTLCNHCEKAPCVEVCPTGAMHKGDGDITMHNPKVCIGCKTCIAACPYGVISFNKKKPYKFWKSDEPLIKGATSSPREVVQKVKATAIPYYNPDREATLAGAGTRYKGIVEKCTLCDHRVKNGKLPYCVQRCPAKARIFGDLNAPNSAVNRILGKYRSFRLKEHLGTKPKVYYVRSLNPGTYQGTRGSV
ncbi:MAG: 4Fe-4S dicluster domain-containing protein [Omnitrophica bacterium]|nr:4Fe-4S dicluster domain-containing protein [Candidatus Omnitrophota bacterium]